MTCRKPPRAEDDTLSPIPEAARHGKPADLGGMAPLPEKVRAATNNRLYSSAVWV
jgi:hypothetical protein